MAAEIEWEDAPPDQPAFQRLDIIRCGPTSLPPLIALNTRHCGAKLHYWQGRSYPHLKEHCPACAAKNNYIWKGYIGVWNPSTRAIGILEFTFAALSALDSYYLAQGTCRGATLTLKRSNGKANGKLLMTVARSMWGIDKLPPAPDVHNQLAAMWGSKRDEQFISTKPDRAIAEANEPNALVKQNRAIQDAMTPESNGEKSTISLQDAGRLLAGRFTIEEPKQNGKKAHDQSNV